MKRILLLCAFLSLVACDANAPGATLPPNVQTNVDALSASGQGNAALTLVAQSQKTVAVATALAQSTRDSRDATATRDALELQYAHITETAVARGDLATSVMKTETAHRYELTATATRELATTVALAQQTTERRRNNAAATADARAAATATYVAQAPTRVAIMRIQSDEQAARDQTDAEAKARAELVLRLAPLRAAIDMFWVPVFLSLLAVLFLIGLWMAFRALARYMDSRTEERMSSAVVQRVLLDRNGYPVGFISENTNGTWTITAVGAPPQLPATTEAQPSSQPPIDVTATQAIAEPDPLMINGFIHWSSLLAFTRTILETGDWTQTTWADKMLPRGYILTKDTTDANGNPVYGGYARLLELFVQKQLIVGRKPGSAGKWNPNAPQEVEGTMAILIGKAPMPPLPPPPQTAQTKRKLTGKPILTAN